MIKKNHRIWSLREVGGYELRKNKAFIAYYEISQEFGRVMAISEAQCLEDIHLSDQADSGYFVTWCQLHSSTFWLNALLSEPSNEQRGSCTNQSSRSLLEQEASQRGRGGWPASLPPGVLRLASLKKIQKSYQDCGQSSEERGGLSETQKGPDSEWAHLSWAEEEPQGVQPTEQPFSCCLRSDAWSA